MAVIRSIRGGSAGLNEEDSINKAVSGEKIGTKITVE